MPLSPAGLCAGAAPQRYHRRSALYCSRQLYLRSRRQCAGAAPGAALVPPTAVFCHSDVMALGALSLAKRRGLKVPDDLSIVGFDNIALSEFCDPPLTTVSQPRFDIGREGMLLLLEQMQGHNVNSGSRLLDCELIVRGSTQKIRR
ncbi:substrate-binding domain-containing protein [Klebsiella pneumoniae]|nr:substrate-binding domain-containing protein [Klebsiella pneumoniae]